MKYPNSEHVLCGATAAAAAVVIPAAVLFGEAGALGNHSLFHSRWSFKASTPDEEIIKGDSLSISPSYQTIAVMEDPSLPCLYAHRIYTPSPC